MEAFSIASAAVSLILGAYAIWLSIVFYRMSNESANRMEESSKDLGSSVSKLEKLFDHLYSDTFSMMRDTYSDMRKHVWPDTVEQESGIAQEIEGRTDEKVSAIRSELLEQIDSIAAQLGGADSKLDQIRHELVPVVDKAILKSRNAEEEAREETFRDVATELLRMAGRGGMRATELLSLLEEKNQRWGGSFFSEIPKMRDEGIISYNPDADGAPNASDRIVYVGDRSSRRRSNPIARTKQTGQ